MKTVTLEIFDLITFSVSAEKDWEKIDVIRVIKITMCFISFFISDVYTG